MSKEREGKAKSNKTAPHKTLREKRKAKEDKRIVKKGTNKFSYSNGNY